MCGIIAINSYRDITNMLIDGLKQLEYRGYDSSGMAVIDAHQQLNCSRRVGKIRALEQSLKQQPISGTLGIAHTRWATHGKPCEKNAHPHLSDNTFAIVHNGIIENYENLKKDLQQQGTVFYSDTDSEVIVHLFNQYWRQTGDGLDALLKLRQTLQQGAYAVSIINTREPNRLLAMRVGSPLVVGLGQGENGVASDIIALLDFAEELIYLEEGDIADIRSDKVTIYDSKGNIVQRETHPLPQKKSVNHRGHFRHYMLKEIFEQPQVIADLINNAISETEISANIFGADAERVLTQVEQIQIVACGTSYHAGLAARYWLESIVGIPCRVEVASEIRYRRVAIMPNTLFLTISQSGETADTLAALKQAKQSKQYLSSLAICNVAHSSLRRNSAMSFLTQAGTEISVASTKAFTTQLVSLLLLTAVLAKLRGMDAYKQCLCQLKQLPDLLQKALSVNDDIAKLAEFFTHKQHCLFLGRGTQYPIAMEGALKLKEISYIHAEAYAAGELKHGPLALIDEEMPVIAIAPENELFDKLKSNLQEVQTRGGKLIVFSSERTKNNWQDRIINLSLPAVADMIAPIIYAIPMQLLAYHVAAMKGTDIDQPRNLAKSVTVE
ncbi:MAG: glutamine--fructose-6-phosphate transaminase (isomerizing) [Pseudomonadota bacterium]